MKLTVTIIKGGLQVIPAVDTARSITCTVAFGRGIGGGGSEVTKEYVDAQDSDTLTHANSYTDEAIQSAILASWNTLTPGI